MKQGRTIRELAVEIDRQLNAKADYVASTKHLGMFTNPERNNQLFLMMKDHGDYGITTNAHNQIADRLGIPQKYYNTMRANAPDLLTQNVNHWFKANPENRLVRTLDGNARAYLSKQYRRLDNHDLADAVLPALRDHGADVHSCEITEDRFYIKGVIDSVTQEVPPPPPRRGQAASGNTAPVVVSPGLIISNSEIGLGSLMIQPAIHFLRCTNMATWASHALRKRHVGAHLAAEDDGITQYLSDRTLALSDAAFWGKVKDMTAAALDGAIFQDIVSQLHAARQVHIDSGAVPDTVRKLADSEGLTGDEQSGILQFLIEGGDLTQFGLSNAVTRYSQEVDSYDRATHLEHLGGSVIALPRNDWNLIAA